MKDVKTQKEAKPRKGFFRAIYEAIDRKLQEKGKESGCCAPASKEGKKTSCCG